MHRERREDCKITYTYGNTETFAFSRAAQQLRAVDERNASALKVNPKIELVALVEVALAAHH